MNLQTLQKPWSKEKRVYRVLLHWVKYIKVEKEENYTILALLERI